jgi:hypothetical protein
MDNTLVLTIVGPVITALIGLVVVWLQDWRRGRDAYSQRAHARTEATELATFYEKWIKTQQLVATPEEYEAARQVVQDRLDRLAATLPEPEEVDPSPSFSLRQVLLLYRPASRGGWIAHVAFYAMFALTLLATIGSFMPDPDGTFAHWTEIVGVHLVLIIPLLVLRTVAVAVDARDRRRYLAGLRAQAPTTSRERVEPVEPVEPEGSPVPHP